MRLNDNRLTLIDSIIDDGLFDITDRLVKSMYHQHLMSENNKIQFLKTKNQREKAYKRQYEYTRRNLLKVKYLRNNKSAKGIKEGFVYAIVNPAFPNHVKIGSAIDVYSRLASYQTSSPFRDYKILAYFYSSDRIKAEKELHSMFAGSHEWCELSHDNAVQLFRDKRKANAVKV